MSLETPRKSGEVPHSNKFGPAPEAPVRDFDKTPLKDAVDNDLIRTPDHAGALVEKQEKKKSKKSLYIGISAAAGVALAAGAVFGINSMNQSPNTEPVPAAPAEPNEEAPVEAAPEPNTPENTSELGPELGFDQEPQVIGEELIEGVITNWHNAGAVETLSDDRYEANLSYEEYLPLLAAENAQKYATEYFVDPSLYPEAEIGINTLQETNLSVLEWYSTTAFNTENPVLEEGYRIDLSVDGDVREISNDGEVRVLEVDITRSDNTDGKMESPIGAGAESTFVVSLVNEDGQAKIQSIASTPR